MKINYCLCFTVGLLFISPFQGNTQENINSVSAAVPTVASGKGLFDSDDILEITLKGNVRALLNDRSDNPKDHPFQLIYKKEDSSSIQVPVEAKTRGNFRRQKGNCYYPPVLLQFPKGDIKKSSVFKENKKLKLVMPCRGDQSIIHEWLVY